jgi:ABC-type arginine transport system ATPase subunit
MRSSTMEQEVGLLLFDEPSASLDPAAEHGTVDICLICVPVRS